MSLIGKTLNKRFYILDPMARGGMGHTYLAEDRKFQARHHCIVKHLDPLKENLPYLDKIKIAFESEADTLANLSLHSNLIPKLIDRFEEDGQLYIAIELIKGAPLSAELTAGKKLDRADTIELLIQILTPLKYCHDEGLIHRDLKPDNIMRRHQTRELVLIDFGLVKDMGAAIVTQHSYGGTPGYAPEEQLRYGEPELASDIYAAGMIAIQALTGIAPASLRRNSQTMEWDLHRYCDIDDDLTMVLNRMGEFFAERRYQNASEALAAFQALSTSASTPRRQPSANPAPSQPATTPPPPVRPKFTFQTAKLEIVTSTKIVTKPGFLGFKKQVEVQQPPQLKITKIPGAAEYFTENLGNSIDLQMVYIPAGSFMMGSNESDREKPIHRVTLPPFCMGRYTITQKQYQAIMGNSGGCSITKKQYQDIMGTDLCRFKYDNHPAYYVSWDDATEFCLKLSQRTGKTYTLPSESQWEYACRAGTATPFCFGETITPDLANYNGKQQSETTDVGGFPPNAFGLYDMHGNVWEWCLDTFHENYTGAPTDGSAWIGPKIENENRGHMVRGGSYNLNPDYCRSAYRYNASLTFRDCFGFRLVVDL